MNMMFLNVDGEFVGSSVGYVEQYNEFFKKKPRPSFANKAKIIGEYYQQIKDVHAKVIVSENAWFLMNADQKGYVAYVQDASDYLGIYPIKNKLVYFSCKRNILC